MLLSVCRVCGQESYPAPLICGGCKSGDLGWADVAHVMVEQTTCASDVDWQLATVRTDAGARLIARVPLDCCAGDRLPLLDQVGPAAAWVPPDPLTPAP